MSLVLVVEDNAMALAMLCRLLEDEGHQVIAAEDGASGVSIAWRRLPDVILMDVGLPLINGLDATRVLKREPRTHPIPIVAVTAAAMKGDRERAFEAGCDGYVSKPIDLPHLLELIGGLLARRSAPFLTWLARERGDSAAFDEFNCLRERAARLAAEDALSRARIEVSTLQEQLDAARPRVRR